MSEQARTRAEQTLFEIREATRDAHAAIKDAHQAERRVRDAMAEGDKLLKAVGTAIEQGVDDRVQEALDTALENVLHDAGPQMTKALNEFSDRQGEELLARVVRDLRQEVIDQLVEHLKGQFDLQVESLPRDQPAGLSIRAPRETSWVDVDEEDYVAQSDALTLVKASGWPLEQLTQRSYRVRPPDGRKPVMLVLGGDTRNERNAISELRRRGIEKAIRTRQRQRERDRRQALQNGREAAERRARELVTNPPEYTPVAPPTPAQEAAYEPEIQMLSVSEAAEAMGTSRKQVTRWIEAGQLPADKVPMASRHGFRYQIAWPSILGYIETHG